MLRAVIYDLDGTLVDSREDLADSVNALLAELGLPELPLPTVVTYIGEGAERLVRRSLGEAHEHLIGRALPRWSALYRERLLRKTRPYPGVAALLCEAPALRAVLTNKPGALARDILEGLGLAAPFAAVVGGDQAPRKPSPEGLLGLCRALGVAPREALLVGDSLIDVATGAAACVPVCAVTWGLGDPAALASARPDYLCHAVGELPSLLQKLRS